MMVVFARVQENRLFVKLLVAELLVTAQLFKPCLKPFPLEPILFSNSIHRHEPQFVSLFYSRFITSLLGL